MNLAYFRINSGEWIVGEDKGDNDDEGILIGKPRVLSRMPIANGELGIVLVPYDILHPDGDVVFHPDHIQSYVPRERIGDKLEKNYIESTTDIIIASKH